MFITQCTWPIPSSEYDFDSDVVQAHRAKAVELGGEMQGTIIATEPNLIVQRTWATEAIANEWVAFVTGLDPTATMVVTEEETPPTP
jgi:hypothetical protein